MASTIATKAKTDETALVTARAKSKSFSKKTGASPHTAFDAKIAYSFKDRWLQRNKLNVVVVGTGPAGLKFVNEFAAKNPDAIITLYGEEPHQPYNRVLLSSLLDGSTTIEQVMEPAIAAKARVVERFGVRVVEIDADNNTLSDSDGNTVQYDKLILATGSYANVPDIPGIGRHGVYTLRNLDDAQQLQARKETTQHTVVLGGGLLGLEAAKAMHGKNTHVTVINQSSHLLSRQLDKEAAEVLQQSLEARGLKIQLDSRVVKILGDKKVDGVQLNTGAVLTCDTVIVATGVTPSVDLALSAKLRVGRGVVVNDAMQTSRKDIYAIGECAEYDEKTVGLVGPCLEQASVAASHLAGEQTAYTASASSAKLKIPEVPVFSATPSVDAGEGRDIIWKDDKSGSYRKLRVHRFKVVGASSVGPWDETHRLRIGQGDASTRVYPWQLLRFKLQGRLWAEGQAADVASWPETAVVCQCTGVTRGQINQSVQNGATSVAEVATACAAGSVCGSCKPLVAELLGDEVKPEAAEMQPVLAGIAVFALVMALLMILAPAIPYANSVQSQLSFQLPDFQWLNWNALWLDGFAKQVTVLSVLGVLAMSLLVLPRKTLSKVYQIGRKAVTGLHSSNCSAYTLRDI